jgi:chromate transporter
LELGATAFGGPAMIPYIRKMAVDQKQWLDNESFKDGAALCQIIPGATAMQMAAFVGLKTRGVLGAAASYLGFGLPAFLLMLLFSYTYARTHTLPAMVAAFSGLQAVIVAVVANATLSFGKTTLKKMTHGAISIISAGLFWLNAKPVLIIILAALLGILLNSGQPTGQSKATSKRIKNSAIPIVLLLIASVSGFTWLFFFRNTLFHLAVIMSKIDLMAFGGGFASIPLMFHACVDVHGWMDSPTFLNGIVLGQFTPGPIVITATFVGYLLDGLPGAFIATAAIFLPSFLILIGVAPWFDRLRALQWFGNASNGVLCSFVGLLLTITLRFGLHVTWDWPHAALAIASFTALIFNIEILWVIFAGTLISLTLF